MANIDLEPRRRHPPHTTALAALKYNPHISLDWTHEEQLALQEELATFASYSGLILYAKIATKIPTKTIRDIALRVKWMKSKEDGMKKKKKNHHNLTSKSKNQKERVVDLANKSSDSAAQANILPYSPKELRMDNDDGISLEAILGAAKALLEQNKQLLSFADGNLASIETLNLMKFNEEEIILFGQFLSERQQDLRSKFKADNFVLFEEIRYNINKVLNAMNSMPMPPLRRIASFEG